jgi:hypothetical protein
LRVITTHFSLRGYTGFTMFVCRQLWTTVAFLHCCNLIWGLANNNYSLYFLQFLTDWQFTFVLYFLSLSIVGPFSKLTETSFFCWRSHKYELLQFCVVLDHSTVIFQKRGGGDTYKKSLVCKTPIVKVDRNNKMNCELMLTYDNAVIQYHRICNNSYLCNLQQKNDVSVKLLNGPTIYS